MFKVPFIQCMEMSNRGQSHSFKDFVVVANSFTSSIDALVSLVIDLNFIN